MTVLVSHPTGNQNVRAVLRALERNGMSPVFFTTLSISRSALDTVSSFSPGLVSMLSSRLFGELPASRIKSNPWREAVRQLAGRMGLRSLTQHERGWASTDEIFRTSDSFVGRTLRRGRIRPKLAYAYEDAALETFRECRHQGLASIYELPTPYWRVAHKILDEERRLQPDWAVTLDALLDSPAKLARKDLELSLSDTVVVPSRFVAESLSLSPHRPTRIEVIPYGAPSPLQAPLARRAKLQPLRILYAGQLTQRKGLSYLFEALSRFEHPYELTLAGPLPVTRCSALEHALAQRNHRYIARLPHAKLIEHMAENHVLVFPTLADGFGLVVTEALSAGLPVIATTNSCGPEIIVDGSEGFVVPIRDPDAIANRLRLLYEDEDRRRAMADSAKRTAAAMSWASYEDRVAGLVRELTA